MKMKRNSYDLLLKVDWRFINFQFEDDEGKCENKLEVKASTWKWYGERMVFVKELLCGKELKSLSF